ncbi:glr3990 [Gloeobacter violaceus PCC 7421]|uniref:Probable membrane transporter protein n=1 Tax=Gloeobacter violaceus (strain ATCC 29082 / PCC 7421) TaxID=251221 RepID=Q7NE90_GLOVI|nr:glr3990 [Gloeobacter violaceus PCC 7421]
MSPAYPGSKELCRASVVTILALTGLIWIGALLAGFLGALTGLGGGVVIVPLLTLVFGVDIHYAIGASLVSVAATSSAAAAVYLKQGFANIRIALVLELATTLGAVGGAVLALQLPTAAIAVLFGLALLLSAYLSARPPQPRSETRAQDKLAGVLELEGEYPDTAGPQSYRVRSVGLGFGLMGVAGMLSGLLGIGSGALKVLAMDQVMGVPFKVSTATSNFMIGVTAAASAGVYLSRGYIDPGLTMPVMLGVLVGSLLGARVFIAAKPKLLRPVFAGVIALLAVQMIAGAFGGRFVDGAL